MDPGIDPDGRGSAGSAPAVLYLPGASGRSASFRAVAERLARRRPPLLVDYPGLGDTPATPRVSSVPELVDHLAEVVPGCVDVVARSMGCRVALELAVRHPGKVRRLTLLAPSGGVDVVGLGGLDWRPAFRAARPSAPMWLVDDRTDLTAALPSLDTPTLVIQGDQDLVSPVVVGEHLVRHLPHASLEVLAGATHDLELEQPDVVASLIEAHLRRRP